MKEKENTPKSPWLRLRRTAQTGLVLQKHALGWLVGKKKPTPLRLRKLFEELGTTYVKIGQLIASMPSVFPAEYVEAFQGCLDQTNPLPFKVVQKILTRELEDPSLHFSWIDEKPLASASIAQVHAAKLHNGADVVIKVQRNNALGILKADLTTLHMVTRALEMVAPKLKHLSLSDMVDEIKTSMLEECDFLKEADNIATYESFLRSIDTQAVRVPKVYRDASTRHVLTMERFFGVPLTDVAAVKHINSNPEAALVEALNVWFASVNKCRIYHADLHSGNVMMLDNGQIGFIDFGIVGSISEDVWQAILSMARALPTEDFDLMAEAMQKMGATDVEIDSSALARDLESFYHRSIEFNADDLSNLESSLDDTLLQLAGIGKNYGIRFPRSFTLLIKQFLYFDRYTQALAPDLDIFQDSRMLMG